MWENVKTYVKENLARMQREPEGILRYPYIVPWSDTIAYLSNKVRFISLIAQIGLCQRSADLRMILAVFGIISDIMQHRGT